MPHLYSQLVQQGLTFILIALIIVPLLFTFMRYLMRSIMELQSVHNVAQIKVLDDRLHDLVEALKNLVEQQRTDNERVIAALSRQEERALV